MAAKQTGPDDLIRIAFECEDIIYRFTAHFDDGEYAEMERYFAPDGVWRRPDGAVIGVEGLRKMLAARKNDRVMRHLITNMRTTMLADDHVRVDSYVTVYLHIYGESRPDGPMPLGDADVVGRYHDELRLIDGKWLISLRAPAHDFKHKA